ncbi:MAG: hypothetical protein KBC05_10510 [Candidatus Hydrogenedentes bacterium]|nr:hypothetical protein [Candidatus Hydrogenedentota bacterium]
MRAAGPIAAFLLALNARAELPARWISRGPGGGGALFGPSISPHDPDDLFVSCDMGLAFRSADFGRSWETLDFRQLTGHNRMTWVQYTSDPNVLYALSTYTPMKSTDGGHTWREILVDPWSREAYAVFADPERTNRVLVANYEDVYFSAQGGTNYALVYATNDCHAAGAFFDGNNIYVGTRAGLIVSTNGGASFARSAIGGLPASEEMVSLAGAREGGVARLFCVTLGAGDLWPGVTGSEYGGYQGIYALTPGPGAAWTSVVTGIAAGDYPFFVSMCRTNINTVYVAGGSDEGVPIVYKTTNSGGSWQNVFFAAGNQNIATGWQGDDPGPWNWMKWSYGEYALGFNVCPTDPDRAAISDLGFVHVTTDGGAAWNQAYVHPTDQNATNSPADKRKSYHGVGLEDTSCWWLTWAAPDDLYACFTDMRGVASTNAGVAWYFPTGLTYNSTYQCVRRPSSGVLYAAASSVHDLYAWDEYCRDTRIDGGSGAILYSENNGRGWKLLHDFSHPVVGLALDPNNDRRMLASVVHSTLGGLFLTTNLEAGTSSTWSKLTNPPRTEGHPYIVHILNDGTFVCSYSARISGGDFTASAGVFASTNNGAGWLDRSAAGMHYYTKDVVLDPHDALQRTWYAGVWGEWGSSEGWGGLYRTTNRGIAWTRITTGIDQAGSCAIHPANPNEVYVTTENQGLWISTNVRSASPFFVSLTNYPFRHPTRVFFNPHDTNEVWVTSFGNGLRVGRMSEPAPALTAIKEAPGVLARVTAQGAAGQRLLLQASADLLNPNWLHVATGTVLDRELMFDAVPPGFYRAAASP